MGCSRGKGGAGASTLTRSPHPESALPRQTAGTPPAPRCAAAACGQGGQRAGQRGGASTSARKAMCPPPPNTHTTTTTTTLPAAAEFWMRQLQLDPPRPQPLSSSCSLRHLQRPSTAHARVHAGCACPAARPPPPPSGELEASARADGVQQLVAQRARALVVGQLEHVVAGAGAGQPARVPAAKQRQCGGAAVHLRGRGGRRKPGWRLEGIRLGRP